MIYLADVSIERVSLLNVDRLRIDVSADILDNILSGRTLLTYTNGAIPGKSEVVWSRLLVHCLGPDYLTGNADMALDKDEMLSMTYLLQVLFVRYTFIQNLKGPGYEAAKDLYV